jgi:hypothetical protein
VQPDQAGEGLTREDVVAEVDEHARRSRGAARLETRSSSVAEVLDEERARALAHIALDLRVAAEALGLLAHVLHRQAETLGDPRRVGDSGGLASRHHVELLEAHVARQHARGEVNQLGADAWIEDELAAVDVHRARPARGEDERLI